MKKRENRTLFCIFALFVSAVITIIGLRCYITHFLAKNTEGQIYSAVILMVGLICTTAIVHCYLHSRKPKK